MSGGYFDTYYGNGIDSLRGEWRDEELNDLFYDLFGTGWNGRRGAFGREYAGDEGSEFGPRGGGLFESLDYWLSGDISEESYREAVRRFKRKWFGRTPKNRVEYYKDKFDKYARQIAEQFRGELEV